MIVDFSIVNNSSDMPITFQRDFTDTELYSKIAEVVSEQDPGSLVDINSPYGDAEFHLIPRSGAFFIKEVYNHIKIDSSKKLDPVYLTKIDPEHNNYKFYELEQISGDTIRATYGRIGSKAGDRFGVRTYDYPKNMYFLKLAEKLHKGYQIQTDIYLSNSKKETSDGAEDSKITPEDLSTPGSRLFNLLLSYSKTYISQNCVSNVVTPNMVKETRKLIKYLYRLKTVKAFNKSLMKIMVISPRRVSNVQDCLANSTSDFQNILSREENLLMAMEAVVISQKPTTKKKKVRDFGEGFEVYIATDEQKKKVMSKLSDTLKPKVFEIYRVIPKKQQERFNNYIKSNNITHIKELWHGSKNCNWLSIINNGLLLNPNAEITGKMYGNGIYFAPTSLKSWGYTSYRGTYWANGSSDTAFMGLYACAYGNPYYPNTWGAFSQDFLDKQGCDCVHAKSGVANLRNDEIVFYNESAMVLNYIVEFK